MGHTNVGDVNRSTWQSEKSLHLFPFEIDMKHKNSHYFKLQPSFSNPIEYLRMP